jgi:hypothetical protein
VLIDPEFGRAIVAVGSTERFPELVRSPPTITARPGVQKLGGCPVMLAFVRKTDPPFTVKCAMPLVPPDAKIIGILTPSTAGEKE